MIDCVFANPNIFKVRIVVLLPRFLEPFGNFSDDPSTLGIPEVKWNPSVNLGAEEVTRWSMTGCYTQQARS